MARGLDRRQATEAETPAARNRHLSGPPASPMELREFAERILFATTLDEKLAAPEILVDERPGPGIDAPQMPGRPPGLAFKLV